MTDHATPNLASRDYNATLTFYRKLGFSIGYRSGHWLILTRGGVQLEFFLWPDLDPKENYCGCCIHLDDIDELIELTIAADIPAGNDAGIPRIVPPQRDISGLNIAYLVDPDGNLLRLVQNAPQA